MTHSNLPQRDSGLLALMDNWPFTLGDVFRLTERPTLTAATRRGFPIDVIEEDKRYIIEASVPGINKDEIEVSLEDNNLTIQIRQGSKTEHSDKNYVCRERWSGIASRTVSLPFTSGEGDVEASLKDGVLTLVVNKAPEKQVKKISIK
ncbi:MAG: Hsp20/alpha crystallin family protein [Deltaproteobacteria bacterium]|nr:Hsp20/alpha crystallin family protein [Deltaproteobacteria bacterium]